MSAENLDYNLAYYGLTQARANQLATDQKRYIFVEFDYNNHQILKNVYKEKDNNQTLIFKIEVNDNNISGTILVCKKNIYPETLYDYVTLNLDDEFYEFYLTNKYNPKYLDIDLRAVWYFVALDRTIEFYIKKVRDTKYVFSYKIMCDAFDYPDKDHSDIRVCCKNVGIMKKRSVLNHDRILHLCPKHYSHHK